MYKAIFFDVDDTLLDFTLCSREALEKTFARFALPFSDAEFACFQKIDNMLWTKQKQGLLSIEQVLEQRFRLITDELGLDISGDDLSAEFLDQLCYTDIQTPYAAEILAGLHKKYKLYVTSNGILNMQKNRLKLSGLFDYFDDFYVSDDIGYEKPDARFFDECLSRCSLDRRQALMVGDSFAADIKGAKNAGLDACWYNPKGRPVNPSADPKYIIAHLSELESLL